MRCVFWRNTASVACNLAETLELIQCFISEELRNKIRETAQYGSLKHLYLSGTLVDEADTSPFRVMTPNRGKLCPPYVDVKLKNVPIIFSADVNNMLDKMIKAVDEELSEDDLTSVGDTVLPHIEHWDRLVTLLGNETVKVITILPALLGVPALVIFTAIYLSHRGYRCISSLRLFASTMILT